MENTEQKQSIKQKAETSLQAQPANKETAVAQQKPQSPQAQFKHFLTKYKSEIEAALPKHLTADRMIRVALTSVSKTPKLLECGATNLFACVIQASQMGLEIDNGLGHAWMLPYENKGKGTVEAQLIIGYMGMIELAYRSGLVKSIHSDIVYAKDEFDFAYGSNSFIKHKPAYLLDNRGDYTCAYAVAELTNGGTSFVVLTKKEILRAMAKSMSRGNFGPWKTDFDEMTKKTGIRRLFKKLPKSPEIQRAIHLDALAEQQIPQELDILKQNEGELVMAEFVEHEEIKEPETAV